MAERWPRMMRKATAARYCDLSVATFLRQVSDGTLPEGRLIASHECWDKVALDKAIDALMGAGETDWRSDLRKRYGKAA